MGVQIFQDRVAIIPMADPDKIGSLYVPEVAKGRSVQGVVAMVGKECTSLKRGDHVLYPAYNGQVVDIEGTRYIVMYEKDVTCKLVTEPLLVPGLFMELAEEAGRFVPASEDFVVKMLHLHYEDNYGDVLDRTKLDRKSFTK